MRDHQKAASEIILAIECAVGSGSIAVLSNGDIVASTSDDAYRPSRAEEVLGIIDQLLKKADVTIGDVHRIAVSAGPGSYSGIRIGLATALGLKHSLGITCTVIPLLQAMAAVWGVNTAMVAAIPVGKKDVAWQSFSKDGLPIAEPELAPESDFIDSLDTDLQGTLVAHTDLTRLRDRLPASVTMHDAGSCLAEYLGSYAACTPTTVPGRPLYLRNRTHTGQIPT